MEKNQLPAARKLELIPIERRNLPEADHKQKIRSKRKERDNASRGLIAVTVASMMLNAVCDEFERDEITEQFVRLSNKT